jgi:hypothetical protein
MATKKNNKRKYAAVVLGIVGVAGLSMASASNLAITSAPNIATGTQTIDAACDGTVAVDYTNAYNATTHVYDYTEIVISGVDGTACNGLTMSWKLHYNSGSEISGTVPVVTGTNSYTVDIADLEGNNTTLDDIDITIG